MKIKVISYLIVLIGLLPLNEVFCAEFSTNKNPVGLEHNVLFNAATRYIVTQTGSAQLDTIQLFDGKFHPSYTSVAPTESDPTVIEISGLPSSPYTSRCMDRLVNPLLARKKI